MEGRATIAGREVVTAAVPADDMMQAFAYRHLVPAQDLKVALVDMVRPRGPAGGVQGGNVPAPVTRLDWSRPMTLTLAGEQPVKIPTDGSAEVRITGPSLGGISRQIEVELSDPPPGLTVKSVSRIDRGLSVVLHCDAGKTRPGRKGNLIANAFLVWTVTDKEGKMRTNRWLMATLPAIPFEVVKP